MKSFHTDALGCALLLNGGHELVGWQNAVMADKSDDLRPKRNEGDEINRAERTQENPTRKKIIRQFDVPAPGPAGEPGEKSPMTGDKSIGELRDSGDDRSLFISAPRPSPLGRASCRERGWIS